MGYRRLDLGDVTPQVSTKNAGKHPLPANPNCVAFAGAADGVLQGRSWADVQRLAVSASASFHAASGLAVLVGLSWRVALDRKNRRRTQVTAYFVFDGPATASHLDTLEAEVAALGADFGAGSVERVPATGVHAVLWVDGVAYSVWGQDADGTCWMRKLEPTGGAVRPVRVDAAEAGELDVAAELLPAIGVPAPYGDAEREIERKRLAFALHFSQRIIEADGVVRQGEQAFMSSVFPDELIFRLGLSDPAVQAEYLAAARTGLSGQIGHHDKLGLIGLFFSACYSDGSLDAREMRVLKDAGEWLGLTRAEVVKYLRRFW